jgi:hypothetical protein
MSRQQVLLEEIRVLEEKLRKSTEQILTNAKKAEYKFIYNLHPRTNLWKIPSAGELNDIAKELEELEKPLTISF